VTTLSGNGQHGGGEDKRWKPSFPNSNIRMDCDGMRPNGAPFGFDRVIVSRLGDDGKTGSLGRKMAMRQKTMKVNGGRYGAVVQSRSVNVKEGRLQRAPEKGGDAQNTADDSHSLLFNLPLNCVRAVSPLKRSGYEASFCLPMSKLQA
jgi:hypothetical protein